jgi:hypothetical protein
VITRTAALLPSRHLHHRPSNQQSIGTAAPTSASLEFSSPRKINNPEYDQIMQRGATRGIDDDLCSISSCSVSMGSAGADVHEYEEESHQEHKEKQSKTRC